MTLHTLTPTSDVAASAFAGTTGANFFSVLADGSDATKVSGTDNFETVNQWFVELGFPPLPKSLAVASVTVYVRAQNGSGLSGTDSINGRVRIGATSYNHPAPLATGPTPTELAFVFTTDPSTGLAFTPAGVTAAKFGAFFEVVGYPSPGARIAPDLFKLWVVVDATPLPPDQEPVRAAATLKLLLRRAGMQRPKLTGGLWLLDYAHHTQIDLHHLFGVHEAGNGWAAPKWARGMMAVKGVSVDPMAGLVTLDLQNERPLRLLLYDSGFAKEGGAAKNGLMLITNGATRTFTRASPSTFVDVAGATVTVQDDVEAYAANGQEFFAAGGGRAQDRLTYTNNLNSRMWCAQRGIRRYEYTPQLSSAGAAAFLLTLDYVYHDANNNAWLYYDGPNARWVREMKVAGVTYRATKAATLVAGTRTLIGDRLTGADGELNLAPFTASLFVDGVKGTDVVVGAAMTEAAASTYDIGTKAGTDPARGWIRRRISRQIVWTDIEMARSF